MNADRTKQLPLRLVLQQRFPDIPPHRLPGGFDLVGDIAVLGIVPELIPHERAIGTILLDLHPAIRVVAKRDGQYNGAYRTLPLRVIAGEQRLTTVHRENDILLHLDLAQVYFSTRLAHERARIAGLVQPGERVAVLCSGIGPFPLIIGRHSRAGEVFGIEKNPVAHTYALRNRLANRRLDHVLFLEGDAATVLPGISGPFDRILIVLPHGGETLLAVGLAALRPGGTLHLYSMQTKGCHGAAVAGIKATCRSLGRALGSIDLTTCGHCGPTVHRLCVNAVIDGSE
jgi:tRNA (guanine37-N1)-methyltransferase